MRSKTVSAVGVWEPRPALAPARAVVCIKAVVEWLESVKLRLKLLVVLPQGLKGVVGDGLEVLPRHNEVEQPVAEFAAEKFAWELGHGKKEDRAGQGCLRGRGSRKSRALTTWVRLLRGSGSPTPSVAPVPLRPAPGWAHVVLSFMRTLSCAAGKQFVKLGLDESIRHPS